MALLLLLGLIGWPMYRLFEGYWPEEWQDVGICMIMGLVLVVGVPAGLMAVYMLGCAIRSGL